MGLAFVTAATTPTALRATNYVPAVSRIRESSRRSVPLKELVTDLGSSYWAVFTRLDCDPACGVELLSQTDMFASEPAGRVIRRDCIPHPDNHLVERWQVLIAGAGQTGDTTLFARSIIADARLVGGYLGPHAVGLKFHEPGSATNLFTYAFLNSNAGVAALKSAAFGTSVPGLRVDLVGALPIPQPSTAVQERIAALICTTVEQRERYLKEIRAARKIIEDLPEMQEAHAMYVERRRRAIVWKDDLATLSAWNFASTGGVLGHLRGKWAARLGDVIEEDGIFNGPRFSRIPCQPPHGVDFYSQRDTFLIRPIPRRIVHPGFDDRLLFVPEDTLLLGSHGQLNEGSIFGRVELAACGAHECALTQDILRIMPKQGARDLLYAYLSTPVGLALLRGTAVGTSIPSMRVDLVSALPFPNVSVSISREVSTLVTNAVEARKSATVAESEAIRIVEEEVLPEWLD